MSRQMVAMVGELAAWCQADAEIVDHSCQGRLTDRRTGGVILSWKTAEELRRLWQAAEIAASGIEYVIVPPVPSPAGPSLYDV